MTQTQTIKGFFFIPSFPDDIVPGILTIKPFDSIKLELFGKFQVASNAFEFSEDDGDIENIILGKTLEVGEITLWNKVFRGAKWRNGMVMTNYSFQYCFAGIHLESEEQNSFDYCHIKMEELLHWRSPDLIKYQIEYHDKTPKNISVNANVKDDSSTIKNIEINDSTTLALKQGVNLKTSHEKKEYDFSEEIYVRIDKSSSNGFEDFLQDIRIFEQFISLATMSSVVNQEIKLYKKSNFQEYKNNSEVKIIYNPIQLYTSNYKAKETSKTKWNEYLFYFSDIEDAFERMLQKWYLDSMSAYPIKQHLIDSLNRNRVFTSIDFLIVMQALDGYASRFERKNKGFRNSIQELVDSFQDIDKIKCIDFEVQIATNSRHYYSHFFHKKENQQVYDGFELYNLTNKMRLLLLCCVMRLAGFDNVRINAVLNKSNNKKLSL